MKVAIITLGCRTNQAESFMLEQRLISAGHQVVGISDSPDICVVNTCTVTAKADQQSEQLIKNAFKKGCRVISTGCFSELNSDILAKRYEDIQIVPNNSKDNIIKLIESNYSDKELTISAGSRHRPVLKVQDGCSFSCTYCTIPLARGRSRSRAINDIVNDAKRFEGSGYKEIVLSGIHLGLYGKDFEPASSIEDLLQAMLKATSSIRFRLSSIEITEVSGNLIDLMGHERICRHLHMPIQSGDDFILNRMNRQYAVSDYVSRLEMIAGSIPRIAIGTDVIVGFPGEAESSFNKTKALLEGLPISYLHAFPYSKRPNTAALKFDGHINDHIKTDRVNQLRNLSEKKKDAFLLANSSETLAAVTEAVSGRSIAATTDNYIKVFIDSKYDLRPGMLVNTRIERVESGVVSAYPVKIP